MRKLLPLLLGGLFLGSAAAQASERPDREAELARALEGRVAEAPVDCVNLRQIRGTRIITDTAILYDAGSVIYVNRPRAGADSLDRWDTMINRLHSSQLCSIDTVQLVDPNSSIMRGIVFLGEFVPYRRVRTSSAN